MLFIFQIWGLAHLFTTVEVLVKIPCSVPTTHVENNHVLFFSGTVKRSLKAHVA